MPQEKRGRLGPDETLGTAREDRVGSEEYQQEKALKQGQEQAKERANSKSGQSPASRNHLQKSLFLTWPNVGVQEKTPMQRPERSLETKPRLPCISPASTANNNRSDDKTDKAKTLFEAVVLRSI